MRDWESLKTAGGPGDRRRALVGAFEAAASVAGRSVLVVDDVLTTGTTFIEASRALTMAGATSVVCYAFARTVRSLCDHWYVEPSSPTCPICGGGMRPRFRTADGRSFWGCEGYKARGGCHGIVPAVDGMRQMNASRRLVDDARGRIEYTCIPF